MRRHPIWATALILTLLISIAGQWTLAAPPRTSNALLAHPGTESWSMEGDLSRRVDLKTDADWSTMDSGTTAWLHGVWGSSASDVFAVGSGGTMLHYDGTRWRQMESGTTVCLYSVWGTGPTDVFAVGETGTLLHYDGEVWSSVDTGTSDQLEMRGVWGSGPDDVFAVGGDTAMWLDGFVIGYDGSEWREMYNTGSLLRDVAGTGPNNVFAVSSYANSWTMMSQIYRYDGTEWAFLRQGGGYEDPEWLNGLWGTGSGLVFAAGYGLDDDATEPLARVLRYDGSSWTPMNFASRTHARLQDVWGTGTDHLYAVGTAGTTLTFVDGLWSEMESGTNDALSDVWGTGPDNVFAVGEGGTILHYAGGPDTTPPAPITDLTATTGSTAGTVDLTWTAPGDDGQSGTAAAYTVRYHDTAITSEFAWIAAEDASGEPAPQPAGSSESFTVSGLTAGETYHFAVRAEDEAGNLSQLSNSPGAAASLTPDLGFRPNPDGYRFPNTQICRTRPMFEQYFGTQNVKHPDGTWCAGALQFFAQRRPASSTGYRNAADCWSCIGFSLSSLLSFLDLDQPNAGPYAAHAFERLYDQARSATLDDPLAYYSGVQTGQRYYDAFASRTSSSCTQKIEEVAQGIRDHQPVILFLRVTDTLWHAVTPYFVEELSPSRVDVHVYDSEQPGAGKLLSFHDLESGGHWVYTFVGSLATYGARTGGSNAFMTYSLADGTQQGIPPVALCQSPQGTTAAHGSESASFSGRTLLRLPPAGDWLVRDSLNRRLGWVGGELVSEIPDAYHVPQAAGNGSLPYRTLYLPEADYAVESGGSTAESSAYTLFGDGRFLDLSAQHAPGSTPVLSTTPSLDDVTLSGLPDLSRFDLTLDRELGTESRLARIAGVPLAGDDDLHAGFDGDQIVLSRADGDLTYTLLLEQSGGQLFVSQSVTLEAGQTHTLSPTSWSDLNDGSVALAVDDDGDGIPDETRVLENQARRVYLPMVARNG